MAVCAPRLAPFAAKCHKLKLADGFHQMDFGERSDIPSAAGVHQDSALRLVLSCTTRLAKIRMQFNPQCVTLITYMDGNGLAFLEL